MAALRREHQRSAAVFRLRKVHVSVFTEQCLASLQAACVCRHHQGTHTFLVDDTAADPTAEALGHLGCVAFLDQLEEGRDHILVEADDPQIAARRVRLRCELRGHAECHAILRSLGLLRGVLLAKIVSDRCQGIELLGRLLRRGEHWRHLPLQKRLHALLAAIRVENDVTLDQRGAARNAHWLLQEAASSLFVLVKADAERQVHGVPIPGRELALLAAGGCLHELGHARGRHDAFDGRTTNARDAVLDGRINVYPPPSAA
mmetsp:Transcript_105658/g.297207  ORF Transcript_105658/g.297207 Transcript_105658/m.297207 type:complete len:260 (-) Transcript_105658:5-784(-)